MATLFEWDGGTLPTIIGTAPSVSGSTMTFASGSTQNCASWSVSTSVFTLRWYVTLPSSASSSWSTVGILLNSTLNARVNISGTSAPGQVRFIRSGNTQIANSATNSTSSGQTYRIELQVDRSAQTYRGAVFALGSDNPLYDTGLLTAIDTGASAFTSVQLGRVSSGVSVGDLAISHIKATDSVGSWIGRHSSDGLADPNKIIEWDGGTLPTITGTTPTLDSDNFMIFANGTGSNYANWPVSTNTFTMRFYTKLPNTWASSSWTLFTSVNGSGNIDRVNIAGSASPGQVRYVANGNVQVAASANDAVALSQTVRIELQVDRSAQTYRGAVFALGSDTPLYDTGALSSIDSSASAFTSFVLGRVSSGVALTDLAIGRVYARNTTGAWIGRHTSDPLLVPATLGIWNGSSIDSAEVVGVWNGSSIDTVEVLSIN